jgi:hypothetical protein
MNDVAKIILHDETVKQLEVEIKKHIKSFDIVPPTIIDCRKQCGQYAVVTPKDIWWVSVIGKTKFENLPNVS